MLKPKAISQVLQQANTQGVRSTLLLGLDGSLIAFATTSSTSSMERETRVHAALAADLRLAYAKVSPAGQDDPPHTIMVSCEGGKALVRQFGTLLLCLIANGSGVHFGGLKLKADALVDHLAEPLSQLSM